jgi:antirestriction protein ArdC
MSKLNDVYESITQQIINDLEKGELTWRKPWSSEHLANHVMRPLRWNDIPYTGINTIMLWAKAADKGYQSPYWMTFKQALDMKAHIRKGEISTDVVYADKFSKEEKKNDGSIGIQQIAFLKLYKVFNAIQIDGLPEAFYKLPETKIINAEKRIDEIEQFFAETKAEVFTGSQAAYSQARDRIEMPPFESFNNAANYYATLAHEVTHWTKHPKRLDRDFGRKKHGDEGYAKEELVAELGACFLCADLGFEPISKEQHSAYIQSWLAVLKNDKKFIFQAASSAQKAVEFLTVLQPVKNNKNFILT